MVPSADCTRLGDLPGTRWTSGFAAEWDEVTGPHTPGCIMGKTLQTLTLMHRFPEAFVFVHLQLNLLEACHMFAPARLSPCIIQSALSGVVQTCSIYLFLSQLCVQLFAVVFALAMICTTVMEIICTMIVIC